MAELKYLKYLLENNCRLDGLRELETVAYRFVKADIRHEDNFKPKAILEPERNFGKYICSAYALSFYNNKSYAISTLKSLKKNFVDISNTMGNCIAEGFIMEENGLCSQPNKHGHFDLYEYKDSPSFISIFKIILKVD